MATRTLERPDELAADPWRRGRKLRRRTGYSILVVIALLVGTWLGSSGARVDRAAGPSAFSARVLREGITPVAYPRTREGAVAAAANFAATVESSAVHGGPAAVRQIAAPGRESVLEQAATDAGRAVMRLAAGETFGGPHLVRFMPGMYRVSSVTQDEAVVDVFGSGLVAGPATKKPVVFWVTDRLTLRWVGDWRLHDYGLVDSPSIVGDNRRFADDAPDVIRALDGFQAFDFLGPRLEAGAAR